MHIPKTLKINLVLLVLLLVLGFKAQGQLAGEASAEMPACRAAILQSPSSLSFYGDPGVREFDCAVKVLDLLGVNYEVVSEDNLTLEQLLPFKLLILPDTRCLKTKSADIIKAYLDNGGKLFATYQASYRNELNQKAGSRNDFQLAEALGVHFLRWVKDKPSCAYLSFEEPLPGLPSRIQLGRYTGMLVAAEPAARVLAVWLDINAQTMKEGGNANPAVIMNPGGTTVYCGENLFAPENAASAEIRQLLAQLLNLLEPGIAPLFQDAPAGIFEIVTPEKPVLPPSPAALRVELTRGEQLLGIYGSGTLEFGGQSLEFTDKSFYFTPSEVMLKPYRVNVYDGSKEFLGNAGSLKVITAGNKFITLKFINSNATYNAYTVRGGIELRALAEGLQVINIIALEDYLAGVLPNEILPSYPESALQAMAIVARTFTLSHMGRHKKDQFDLCHTVHCQVYEGADSECASTTQAIIDTAGQVIYYGDELAEVTYHSTCGGVGESVERVWLDNPSPYLTAYYDTPEPLNLDLASPEKVKTFIDSPPSCFCSSCPRFRWQESYTAAELEVAFQASLPVMLKREYTGLGNLLNLKVTERSPYGRVQALRIEGSQGSYILRKDSIRWVFGNGKIGMRGLPSTLFYIQTDGLQPPQNYTFKGGGWGHGVGLCQEGAKGMAQAGFNPEAIIKHYFSGVCLKKLNPQELNR